MAMEPGDLNAQSGSIPGSAAERGCSWLRIQGAGFDTWPGAIRHSILQDDAAAPPPGSFIHMPACFTRFISLPDCLWSAALTSASCHRGAPGGEFRDAGSLTGQRPAHHLRPEGW